MVERRSPKPDTRVRFLPLPPENSLPNGKLFSVLGSWIKKLFVRSVFIYSKSIGKGGKRA